MFDYMVNPSDAPKKSRRKNPELLIVNPYSLDEKRDEQKQRAKMAKKNRRNPSRRRNPDFDAIKNKFLGPKLENVKTAAIMAAGGGFALAVGSAVAGAKFGDAATGSVMAKGLVAILSGVVGGVAADFLGQKTGITFLSDAAVPGAMGAMVLGIWSLVQAPVENAAATTIHSTGLAEWKAEFDGLGQSYYDEFTKTVSPGAAPAAPPAKGVAGWLGQAVTAPGESPFHGWNLGMNPVTAPGTDNPFAGYEPLGDIYGSQRLGSFEAESGYGEFVSETGNPRDQQPADVMKAQAGAYGGKALAGYEGAGPFDSAIQLNGFEPFN
jgi:hypothetical protein